MELDKIRPMIALPFHPSNAYTIKEFKENMDELLHQVDEDTVRQLKLKNRPASLREKIVDGKFRVDQGVIAGCSGGTYQNIVRAAQILDGRAIGPAAPLSTIPPASPSTWSRPGG
ncbi:MAG: aconitase family protein [Flavonifractor plautii]